MNAPGVNHFPCVQCGADLKFSPGSTVLKCPYCGAEQAIAPPKNEVVEHDLMDELNRRSMSPEMVRDSSVACKSCGAEYSMPADQESGACPFCGNTVVVPADPIERIAPQAVMPFQLSERDMRQCYDRWVKSRFWAPNDLKHRAEKSRTVQAIYVPFWTVDALTETSYRGKRGDTYTVRSGNSTTTHTRWTSVSGHVTLPFDDVLVLATTKLPTYYAENMNSWNLSRLVPYDPAYLSGFVTMRYDIHLANGYGRAQQKMEVGITREIERDIGGDRQVIEWKETAYMMQTYKHVLLPIYAGAYRYKGQLYQFFVNGQTGEVRGKAPISVWKVMLAILLGLIVVGTFLYFNQSGSSN